MGSSRSSTCATSRPGPVTISHEAVDAAYRHIEDVHGWHANHERLARMARDAWRDRRE